LAFLLLFHRCRCGRRCRVSDLQHKCLENELHPNDECVACWDCCTQIGPLCMRYRGCRYQARHGLDEVKHHQSQWRASPTRDDSFQATGSTLRPILQQLQRSTHHTIASASFHMENGGDKMESIQAKRITEAGLLKTSRRART